MMKDELPEAFLEGLRLFNAEEFYECHDVLEELWSDVICDEKQFYQGLIQAAVSLFHFGNENLGGARKLYHSSCRLISPCAPECLGIDVQRFLEDFKYCLQELLEAGDEYPTGVQLRDERIPRLHFVVSADES